MRVLWVTNDLPPRVGGIQAFVGALLERVHPDTTVVLGPAGDDAARDHDRAQRYRTVRGPAVVLPTPRTARLVAEVARDHRPDVVVLGASWPLGELSPRLHRELGVPIVALSHGLEAGLASVGGGRLLRRATRSLAALTTISDWSAAALAPHVAATRVEHVPPGVDVDRFHPGVDGSALRARWGVPQDATLVTCVSRLVRRKGQDVLLEAWPRVVARHPDAWLAIVGGGPLAPTLARARRRLGPAGVRVVLTGEVAWAELPAAYAAADVFAMPCRTRLAGTDVEGLGIVYLEAQATGLPAIAGRSGGAPETVLDGVSGSVVDGTDPQAVARSIGRWLADPDARRAAGVAGRRHVVERWSWSAIAARFGTLLDEVVTDATRTRGA